MRFKKCYFLYHGRYHINQRWSRGHKARGQGHKKISRPRTQTQVFSIKKLLKIFFRRSQKKRSSKIFFRRKKFKKIFFRRSLLEETKKRSLKIFHKVSGVFQQNFNRSKIVLSSSRGQGNFRGLEASRTSKCVLEAKDVVKDSTSDFNIQKILLIFKTKMVFATLFLAKRSKSTSTERKAAKLCARLKLNNAPIKI